MGAGDDPLQKNEVNVRSRHGRVLVVDDDPDMLIIITSLLKKEGYQVFQANDGEESLALLGREHPDVVLIDFMLPGLNGLELIRLMRQIDADLQLIAVTGQGDERLAVEMMKSGAGDYIKKPFEPAEMAAAVRRAFEARAVRTSRLYRDLETANRELEKSMNERGAILKSLVDGLFSVDRNLRIISWNPAAESITGYNREEALGRGMVDLFGADFCREEAAFLEDPPGDRLPDREVTATFPARPREPVTILKSASLLRDDQGTPIGLVVTLKDITGFKRLHQQRVEQERELARVQQELSYKDELAEKNSMLEKNMVELQRKISETATLYEVSRILTSKLDLRDVVNTVMDQVRKTFFPQAYSIRLVDDSGERLKLTAQYGLSEAYQRRGPLSIGTSIAGIAVKERRHIHVPDMSAEPRFRNAEDARREGLTSILCIPLVIHDRCIGVMTFYHRDPYDYPDDEIRFLLTFAGTVSIALDNARLYEEKSRLAVTDGLTGLFNHKHFHESVNRECERARRYRHSVAVIIVDIDHFKKFNDAYGHQAGDSLLREISTIFKGVARENDLVARYGGEEFAFFLPQSSKDEAMAFAQRLCSIVAEHTFDGEQVLPGEHLTVSLGVASFPEDAQTPQGLIHMADQALYQAKREGRNRARMFQAAG